jgi:uncharacterized protein YgiM (DUF1202 family)
MPKLSIIAITTAVAVGSSAALAGNITTPPSSSPQPAGQGTPVYNHTVATVVADPGKVRVRPATQSQILAEVPQGTKLPVLEVTATGWAHVRVNGTDGYMESTQLR